MLRRKETGVAAMVLRHEGKSIRRSGVQVSVSSIKLIAALRATFPLAQRRHEGHRLLPERQLVPAKVNVSCSRSMSLSLENVTRALPEFDGDLVDQIIPVAALGDLGDLTVNDIIHGDNTNHTGEADSPERLPEPWLQEGPLRKRHLLKSAIEAGFAVRTLEWDAKKLSVVRSLLEHDQTPRNNWPVVWRLSDMSKMDSDSGQSGSSRLTVEAPFIISFHAVPRKLSRVVTRRV